MTSSTSPISPLCKIGLCSRHKPIRVMVLGQGGVGKTALVVRFITRRFIGEYDPSLEKVYNFHTIIGDDMMFFEILDTAAQSRETECLTLEANIRWAEAFILMYSVTDKCSFDECNRLKFLINYNKRRRRLSNKETPLDIPVVLVGNKTDQWADRMVSLEDGQRRSREIGCVCFHEISVREDSEQVWDVFRDVCHFWKVQSKCPKLKRSSSDSRTEALVSPDGAGTSSSSSSSRGSMPNGWSNAPSTSSIIGRRWTDVELDEEDESQDGSVERKGSDGEMVRADRIGNRGADRSETSLPPFRARASTDGHLLSRSRRWRYLPTPQTSTHIASTPSITQRRMSISMRGNTASY